jgi:UDP-GlcNAc:undecaprenyl-phosphate/decaprenyl-phosphate GlcNAc-1-phosphate transferase
MTVRASLTLLELVLLSSVACGLSFAMTPLVRALALRLGLGASSREVTRTSARIPRLGGLAIVLSCLVAVTTMFGLRAGSLEHLTIDMAYWLPIFAGGSVIFFGGIIDDCWALPARTKFLFQGAGALLAMWLGLRLDDISLFGGGTIHLGVLALPLTYLWIVGLTNAYNLVDGLDGLAAGLGAIAAGTCVVLFTLTGNVEDAVLLGTLAGALIGFLPYNFSPARIYLGDSGSQLIGYLLAVSAIRGSQKQATALAVVIPLLIFGLPILDTLLSMVRRFAKSLRESSMLDAPTRYGRAATRMFEGDRDHIHHRIVGLGLSHRGAVLALYATALILSGLALASVVAHYRNAALILITVGVATTIGIGKLGYTDGGISWIEPFLTRYKHTTFDRSFFMGFVDLVLIGVAYWGAYLLLFGQASLPAVSQWYLNIFPIVMLVQMMTIALCGLYRGVWRAIGVSDLIRVCLAVCAGGVLAYSLVAVHELPDGSAGFFVLDVLALGWLMNAARSAYRILEFFHQLKGTTARPALIYGAGLGGQLVLRELRQNARRGFRPVGFLDDDTNLQGRLVNGVPVVGSGAELETVLTRYPVDALILSSDKISGSVLRQVLSLAMEKGVEALRSEFRFQSVPWRADSRVEIARADMSDAGARHHWIEAGRLRKLGESLSKTAE